MRRNLGGNGYKNSRVMMNQSQLLWDAVAVALSSKMGPCSCIKHEMRRDDWQVKGRKEGCGYVKSTQNH